MDRSTGRARTRWGRGVAILTVGLLAAGAFSLSPASAAKFLTKKKAMKLFYTKKVADARFINAGEKASDSDKLDGMDSAAFQTASAYALVDKNGPSLVAAKTRGFTAVSRPFTGGYCLTPAAGVDLSSRPALAVPDWSLSANTTPYETYAQSTPLDCAAGQLEVITHRQDSLSNDVSFVVFVP